MEKAKLSVIVPIYGVEKYIERCARSLFEQTLEQIEFIFIDDCTPDNSVNILKNIIKEYQTKIEEMNWNIKIDKMPVNSGLPSVRRRGMELSSGVYIAHCDSDDWVDKEMYRLMYDEAEKTLSDIVICDFYKYNGESFAITKGYNDKLSLEDAYKKMFFQEIPWNVWNKIYKAEVLNSNQIQYPTKTQGEDMALNLQVFYYVKSISYVKKPLYYYMMNSDTNIHIINENNVLSKYFAAIFNVDIVESFIKDKQVDKITKHGIAYLKMSQRDMLIPLIHKKKYYELWKSTFPEINSILLYSKNIRLRHKLRYIMLRFHLSRMLIKCKIISV